MLVISGRIDHSLPSVMFTGLSGVRLKHARDADGSDLVDGVFVDKKKESYLDVLLVSIQTVLSTFCSVAKFMFIFMMS